MKRINYLAVAAMVAGLSTPAFATHNHPKKAKFVDVWLVRAFSQCTSGTLFHDGSLPFPSCVPNPVSSATTFGPNGWGRVQIKVVPGSAASGTPPTTDVKVTARLVDVLDAGVPVTSGSLTLGIQLRITDHRCAGTPCTMIDIPFPIPLYCGVPVGQCRTAPPNFTTFNTVLPGSVVGNTEANVEVGQIQVYENNNLVFVQGMYWP